MQTSIVSVNLNLVLKVDSSEVCMCKPYRLSIILTMDLKFGKLVGLLFGIPKFFSTCYIRTIVTKNIVFHV